jgi:trk system potassium uptake protein TrkA
MPRFAVIGLGRFGARLARELTAAGAEVIGIDSNADIVDELRDEVTLAIRLDGTDAAALKTQGINQVEVAIVGMGDNFEATALTTANLKAMGVRRVIARATTLRRGEILSRIGADIVVNPERETAVRWAQRLMMPEITDYVEMGEGHGLVQIVAPKSFHHKSPGQLQLSRRLNVLLVAIRRADPNAPKAASDEETAAGPLVIIPGADTEILPGDILVMVGSNESLAELPQD